MQQRWPDRLWVVRHGESSGNVARDAAHAANLHQIEIGGRDADVPLSPLGERQSSALGRWFAEMPEDQRPEVVLTSPYMRARQTAALVHAAGGTAMAPEDFVVDERLREREFGVLDRLTRDGIKHLHPEQAEFRRALGKFYHRPPGGESWCDVILRLRSALDTVALHYGGARVLIVGHQVVVLCMRYLVERMTEEGILAVDREGDVVNCGITEYAFDPDLGMGGGLALRRYNYAAPLEEEGAPVTAEPDVSVGAR
jgi:2,3-bisphosphoglycerate-dependent phosphoglycerate mutase